MFAMSNTRYRIVPTLVGGYNYWQIEQRKGWLHGWRYMGIHNSEDAAKKSLVHLTQEPLYYVGKGNGV